MNIVHRTRTFVIAQLDALWPGRKALAKLREQWGRPGSKMDALAGRWFRWTRGRGDALDDATWRDLEFPRIFANLDTTVTPLGSQALYRMLREYAASEDVLAERYATQCVLRDDPLLRERLQLVLLPLQEPEHGFVVDTLYGDLAEPPSHLAPITLWCLACVAMLIAAVVGALPAWCAFAVLPINAVILFRYGRRSMHELESLKACLGLLDVAESLCKVESELGLLRDLREQRADRDRVRSALWPMRMAKLAGWVMAWLNLLCVAELVVHVWSMVRFQDRRNLLRGTFESVSGIDAAIALASALVMYPQHCIPERDAGGALELIDSYHPLLRDGVRNSFCLQHQSALVTGSNMAGKTTFVKMVAINVILGRTVGFCLATKAVISLGPVMAAIQGKHSVESGKSHYFAEVETIRGFLQTDGSHGGLFVLDEPFSGTNTTERIAIASAVLRALARNARVLVTSHDVELQASLDGRYALYHFQENPDVAGYFDYRLREGPATERNAIRLLARLGFPEALVSEAKAQVAAADELVADDRSCGC